MSAGEIETIKLDENDRGGSVEDDVDPMLTMGSRNGEVVVHRLVFTESTQYALGIHSKGSARRFLKGITDTSLLLDLRFHPNSQRLDVGFSSLQEMRVRLPVSHMFPRRKRRPGLARALVEPPAADKAYLVTLAEVHEPLSVPVPHM